MRDPPHGYGQRLLREIQYFLDILAAAGYQLYSSPPRTLKKSPVTVTSWHTTDGLVRIEFRQPAPRGLELRTERPSLRVLFPSPERKRRGFVLRGFSEDEARYCSAGSVYWGDNGSSDQLLSELGQKLKSWRVLQILHVHGWPQYVGTSLLANAMVEYMTWYRPQDDRAHELEVLRLMIVSGLTAAGINTSQEKHIERGSEESLEDILVIGGVCLTVRRERRARDQTLTGSAWLQVMFSPQENKALFPWRELNLTLADDRESCRLDLFDRGPRPSLDQATIHAFSRSRVWKKFFDSLLSDGDGEGKPFRMMPFEDLVPALAYLLKRYKPKNKK